MAKEEQEGCAAVRPETGAPEQPWCLTVDGEGRWTGGHEPLGAHGAGRSVAWTSAAPESDLHQLRAWRSAVGPAWLLEGAGTADPRLPVVAATWNARTGGGALRAFWRGLLAERGGAGTPVVALLQEVFSSGDHVPRGADGSAGAGRAGGMFARAGGEARAAAAAARRSSFREAAGAAGPRSGAGGSSRRWAWAERIADSPPGEARTDVVAFAKEEGLSLVYVPSMRNGAGSVEGGAAEDEAPVREDRGNAVLANVPLVYPLAVELPFERQRRVAVAAEARLGGERVAFCSVHLDNRAPWRRAWRSLGQARGRQMAGLLRALATLGLIPSRLEDGPRPFGAQPFGAPWGDAQAPAAFVLGGDLNTWTRGTREDAYKRARRRFPEPAAPDPRPTHRFEIGGMLRRSDHLLFALPPGWRGDCRRLDDTFGSDHYPLVGVLRFATRR